MLPHCFISFKVDIKSLPLPERLNDPFGLTPPSICKIAATELQEFIEKEQQNWEHDFGFQAKEDIEGVKGKMFGVLVVQSTAGEIGYLCGYSGKLGKHKEIDRFVPSLFDDSVDDYFINRGMSELTAIGNQIKSLKTEGNINDIEALRRERSEKSTALQQRLFDHYNFLNQSGQIKNICEIFSNYNNKKPPSAAGECAAPKLFQYAFEHQLKPVAIAEFWWGKSPKSEQRNHLAFYPACRDKCRPILGYMLDE